MFTEEADNTIGKLILLPSEILAKYLKIPIYVSFPKVSPSTSNKKIVGHLLDQAALLMLI